MKAATMIALPIEASTTLGVDPAGHQVDQAAIDMPTMTLAPL